MFRLFRMLLILTGAVGAMALVFPLLQELDAPPQVHRAPPGPAAR
ncbi:MAG: hypothetical protein WAM11_04915 [Cyanobium sp.]